MKQFTCKVPGNEKALWDIGYVKIRDDEGTVIWENRREPGFNGYGDQIIFKFNGNYKVAENVLVSTWRKETCSCPELRYDEILACCEFLKGMKHEA